MEDQTAGIDKLKQLLFEEEIQKNVQLHQKIKEVEAKLDENIKNQVSEPELVNNLVREMMIIMPEKMGPVITETLKVQIKESRDEVVQALFPIIGQMIKKYVQQEVEMLSSKIDNQFSQFTLKNIWLRIKAFFTGTKYSEIALRESTEPQIREIFVIDDESGILMSSYSVDKTLDQDMVAGMLTAIKSFVGDTFEDGNQHLEMISYDLYKIYIQNFHKFYVAAVVSGVVDTQFKRKLDDAITKLVKDSIFKNENPDTKLLTERIEKHFDKF